MMGKIPDLEPLRGKWLAYVLGRDRIEYSDWKPCETEQEAAEELKRELRSHHIPPLHAFLRYENPDPRFLLVKKMQYDHRGDFVCVDERKFQPNEPFLTAFLGSPMPWMLGSLFLGLLFLFWMFK